MLKSKINHVPTLTLINISSLKTQETEILKTLLSGDEVELAEGAFGTLSQQILRLFTEIKLVQSEQADKVEHIPIVSFNF